MHTSTWPVSPRELRKRIGLHRISEEQSTDSRRPHLQLSDRIETGQVAVTTLLSLNAAYRFITFSKDAYVPVCEHCVKIQISVGECSGVSRTFPENLRNGFGDSSLSGAPQQDEPQQDGNANF